MFDSLTTFENNLVFGGILVAGLIVGFLIPQKTPARKMTALPVSRSSVAEYGDGFGGRGADYDYTDPLDRTILGVD
jgi:hypothetical protein